MRHAVMVEGKPNATLKRCFDCYHCQAALSWWCMSKEAKEKYGAILPGYWLCEFWKPCLVVSDLRWYERLFFDYIEITQSTDEKIAKMVSEIPKGRIK